jgi:superfamily II DNA or RNA helicase
LEIDAEIIRSSTAAALDRRLPDDRSVFYHVPYQVISIDYIKADKRRAIFLNDCPELVIVDEAHACAKPEGASSPAQQQRHHLLHDIAERDSQHLVLLTATPHSGKDQEFQSLLGLLDPEFRTFDLAQIDQSKRKRVARHFIQRKRENIKRWLKEVTPFPDRESKEIGYKLSPEYNSYYAEILQFARGISQEGQHIRSKTIRYWAALALLRGVMSSPATAYEMLQNRRQRNLEDDQIHDVQSQDNPHFEKFGDEGDASQTEFLDSAELNTGEKREIERLCAKAQSLYGIEKDWKAKQLLDLIQGWLAKGFNPIVFCKYISTANYLGALLKKELLQDTRVEVITSELADEQRYEMINSMMDTDRRVLVATDCLSEGIDLQDQFNAVIHYDLPWNPNRIEQREGRVDRFGQHSPQVKAYLLWGEDNPVDRIVLEVLIKKVREIQRSTGVTIVLREDDTSIMDALIKDVLLGIDRKAQDGRQFKMFANEMITNELEKARERAENLRSIFAHESIPPEDIEADLKEVDEAIGDLHSVEEFVKESVSHLGGSITRHGSGYMLDTTNLPGHLKAYFIKPKVRISFESPTPAGYHYLGRNHRFVEQLCQFMLAVSFEGHPSFKRVARASVVQTDAVKTKTTLIQFRVRNVIKEVGINREVISEEMYLWGYTGSDKNASTLTYEDAKNLLLNARSKTNIPLERQQDVFRQEVTIFEEKAQEFHTLAEERAKNLVEAHGRFKSLIGGKRYEAVHPVLPPDIMGVHILLPVPKALI